MTNWQKGVYLAFLTALISGGANFVNKLGLAVVKMNSDQYTTIKNIFVALVLTLIILSPKFLRQVKKLTLADWRNLVIIGLVGGSLPFLLFFKGLAMTSAVSASFIHKTLFVWVAVLALPLLKEKLSKIQIAALGLLLFGNYIFEGLASWSWGRAETLILLATLLWAVENIIAKVALKNVSSLVLAWGRMFFGSIILVGYLAVSNQLSGLAFINFSQMGWIILVSVFLFGYVITWYSALKKLPVTVTACILVIASPITTFLNSAFVTHQLSSQKIWGAVILLVALTLFLYFEPKVGLKLKANYEISRTKN